MATDASNDIIERVVSTYGLVHEIMTFNDFLNDLDVLPKYRIDIDFTFPISIVQCRRIIRKFYSEFKEYLKENDLDEWTYLRDMQNKWGKYDTREKRIRPTTMKT